MYSTIISVQALQSLRAEAPAKVVIVDCRHDLMDAEVGIKAYREGHLPGAVFANLDRDLSGAKYGSDGQFRGRHPLPASEDLLMTLRRLGINTDSQVVAYDGQGGMYAARLWWLLRSVGHAAVAVLDGGIGAWSAAGLPLETQETQAVLGNISMGSALTRQVDVEQVLANISADAHSRLQVVDARAADRFRGENETIDPVGGHIPGAVNRFFKDNLQADGRFKDAEQLRAEWLQKITRPEQSIMQCGSGVTACHNLLALEIAGLSGAALYPGSWSEWCADSTRPVATGS